MNWKNINRSFRLNNSIFNSENELINYLENQNSDICDFLKIWFNNQSYLEVKTSGSTGLPKPITIQKEHVIQSALATGNYFNLPEETTALLCLPIHYIAGKLMLVRALVLGWHLDIVKVNSNPLSDITKQYDFSAMTPMQVENSIDKLNIIKKLIVGGGVVSNSLQTKLKYCKTKVYATYGMTETITHIAVKKLNYINTLPNFFDVLPNIEIYKDNKDCLVIKAPKISNNIIFTNDVVQLISNTQFEWLGRFDNIINSGGIKLNPEVIEQKLSKIITTRFFVIGKYDEYLGEKLVLLIEGEEKIIALENTNLSKYEMPKGIYFLPKFIETTSGKIQRKETLKLLETSSNSF